MVQDNNTAIEAPAPRSFEQLWGIILTGLLTIAGLISLPYCLAKGKGALLDARYFQKVSVTGKTFPKTLHGPIGEEITIPKPPKRIASCLIASDEILTQLITPERFVAVTAFSENQDMSNCAHLLPKGAHRLIRAESERILSLSPDLVLLSGYSQAATVQQLISAKIPIVRLGQYETFEDIFNNIQLLGAVTGEEIKAGKLVQEMKQQLSTITQRIKHRARPRVLYYTSFGNTAGENTLIDKMIHHAGGTNVARETNLDGPAQIPLETAIVLRPTVIIIPISQSPTAPDQVQILLNNPLWADVPAIKNKRVYGIQQRLLMCLSQYSVLGVEAIAKVLHPHPGDPGP